MREIFGSVLPFTWSGGAIEPLNRIGALLSSGSNCDGPSVSFYLRSEPAFQFRHDLILHDQTPSA